MMFTTRESRRRAIRAASSLLAIACAMAAAHAEPAGTSPAAPRTDLSPVIQQLKQEALDIGIAVERADEDRRFPPASRTCIDISNGLPHLLVRELTITIDDGEPVRHVYDHDASLALTHGGLHRILELNVPSGTHRLHAEFSASYIENAPGAEPVTGSFEQYFDKSEGTPLTVELALGKINPLSPPAFVLRSWSAAQ